MIDSPAVKRSFDRSWIEIDREAVARNLETLRSRVVRGTKIAAVVKSNAYGHGLTTMSSILDAAGVDWFAVDSLVEGIALRDAGITRPILQLGYLPRAAIEALIDYDLRPTIYDPALIPFLQHAASARGRSIAVHIKVETGTNRQGLRPADAVALCQAVQCAPNLQLEGISMHFANIEDTTDHSFAMGQLSRFNDFDRSLAEAGIKVDLHHTACSAATLLYPTTHFEVVRVGIALYGMWPSRETRVTFQQQCGTALTLDPVLTWKTMVVQIKEVEKGDYVGYGCTYRTPHRSRIAILPTGYYDGYDRRLSNQAYALVHGERAPVRGRICMNLCMVDITDIPQVMVEDEVVLLGRSGNERVTAGELAQWIGTIEYEVTTRINAALPRIVV